MLLIQETQKANQLEQILVRQGFCPKILIVDDDVEYLEELNEILSFDQYSVETISDSSIAFAKARELKPDLVILDLKMKTKNGFQLADELHHSFETKAIPIIAITGFFTKKEHLLMMKMCGIKAMLFKPIDPKVLLDKIAYILEDAKTNRDRSPINMKEVGDEFG